MVDPMPNIVRRRPKTCLGSFPGWFVAGRRLRAIDSFVIRSPRRAAAGPSLCRWGHCRSAAAIDEASIGRGDWSSPLRPVHPGDHGGIVAPAAIWNETGLAWVSVCGLQQAALAGAGDRGGAVLDTQFAVQRTLVGLHGVQ